MEDDLRQTLSSELLSIEVTTRCNSSCGHCFVRAGKSAAVDLPSELAKSVIREGRELGYHNIHFTGGEPLLWEPLFGAVDYALALGYESIFINTNGTLLDRETAGKLAGRGKKLSISISLQGPERLHDAVRGAGSYAAAVRGIEAALDAGLATSVFTTVGMGLVPDLPRFAEFLFSNYPAVRELTLIQLVRVNGDAFDLSADLLTPEYFVALVRIVALLNLYGFRVSVLQNPLAVAVARAITMPWIPAALHLHRGGGVIVMADRSITLAHSTRDSFGAYDSGMLGAVLDSPEYRSAVSADDKSCGACPHLTLCRAGGMARPSEPFRDMNEDLPFCKRVMGLL
ncbi:MAG: radical SAM protein [Spirochaetes bacterium]|nr:radical SAM protein [Spirochaetota bacterium]